LTRCIPPLSFTPRLEGSFSMYHGICDRFWAGFLAFGMRREVVDKIRTFTCNAFNNQVGDPAGGTDSYNSTSLQLDAVHLSFCSLPAASLLGLHSNRPQENFEKASKPGTMPEQQHLDIDLHVRYIQQLDTVRSQPDHKDRTLPPDDILTRLRCASSTKMT
jgi:hypothetical protein